ncbi:MAG: retropepsin-like aspartic protease [Azospirillaceae bacterium]|nr:retropepsin-like aspartic protease [Azospirillaceae bacterium]
MPGQALPIVEATVDGQRGVFIVDTGAPHSALSRRWCVDRGLAWNGAVSHPVDDGAGTRIPAEAVRLGHVAAGGQARDVPAVVFDFPPGLAVAGILSPLDVFGGRPVRLDLRARRLVVGEATGDAGAGLPFTAPLHWRGGVPLVAARVAGRPGFLMVDSGAGGVVLCRAYARISGLHTPQATTTMSAAGALAVGVGLRAGIAVGGSAEVQADIALKPCRTVGPAAPVLALDGLLGVGWLGGRILDFSRDRLSLGFDERVPAA